MNAEEVMDLLKKKKELEKKCVDKKLELFKCGVCLKNATSELEDINNQIRNNNEQFENSLYSMSSIILDPTMANAELDVDRRKIHNGIGFTPCEEHRELQESLSYDLSMFKDLSDIVKRIK